MQISIFLLVLCALAWTLHPRNPHMNRRRRKLEFKYYAKKERRWRAYKKDKPYLPVTIQEKRIWKMDEMEFEEWLTTLWLKSELYELRHNEFVKWAYAKQFEIMPQSNPSPTEIEMDKVKYLPAKTGRSGARA